jgi:hypothetical protein
MQDDRPLSLEEALARTESDSEAVLKAAATATKAVKRFRAAAQVGTCASCGRPSRPPSRRSRG